MLCKSLDSIWLTSFSFRTTGLSESDSDYCQVVDSDYSVDEGYHTPAKQTKRKTATEVTGLMAVAVPATGSKKPRDEVLYGCFDVVRLIDGRKQIVCNAKCGWVSAPSVFPSNFDVDSDYRWRHPLTEKGLADT